MKPGITINTKLITKISILMTFFHAFFSILLLYLKVCLFFLIIFKESFNIF